MSGIESDAASATAHNAVTYAQVEDAIAKERPVIGILTQKDARTEDPGAGDLYMVGCAARILKVIKLAKDNFSVILQGISRIRIHEYQILPAHLLDSRPGRTAHVHAYATSRSVGHSARVVAPAPE